MIKFLIERPIAVFMSFTAFFILGIVTYLNIPVSLLPDIDIPEITVHIAGNNTSSRELENTVVKPLRQQLMQVGDLRDIQSETRDGDALIRLNFEYGTDTELAFVEVNEKIDAAMGRIPRGIDRPRVVKANATDIPVFNLNLTLKDDSWREKDLSELSSVAENRIKRRIEQLPEVALVDMTGLVQQQVMITPDKNLLQITGITLADIEQALAANNTEPGSLVVKEGYYEYNIKFSSAMRTAEDMKNTYLRKNDKLYQLKDLASVEVQARAAQGEAYYNGKRAITMAVIKQSGEKMENLKQAIDKELTRLRENYPTIDFSVSQNQTELLDYSISNLKQNILLAFLFICLVSAFFMHDIRSPLIIGISMFVSLIISLLFFYLFSISLNIVSLTGLILAFGNMIDSSIIVTDNIRQYRDKGLSVDESCIRGTNEVIAPMLSSSFTSIAVFVPLIFLSGIAGAIFFDQAFSVTVGLLVSYICGIMLLPVLYKIIYSLHTPAFVSRLKNRIRPEKKGIATTNPLEKYYHRSIHWIFSHKMVTLVAMLLVFPLLVLLFNLIRTEKMPDISQTDFSMKIDWNENIHVSENSKRVNNFLLHVPVKMAEHAALAGRQQYLLNSGQALLPSEAELYIRLEKAKDIAPAQQAIEKFVAQHYPSAIVSFSPASNLFERIFSTGDPDLVAGFYNRNKETETAGTYIPALQKELTGCTGICPKTTGFQRQLNLHIDKQQLTLYGVSYNDIYKTIKTGLRENEFTVLRSNQDYLPVVIGQNESTINDLLAGSFVPVQTDKGQSQLTVALNTFISTSMSEDAKTITAGKNGEYLPFRFYDLPQPEKTIRDIRKEFGKNSQWELAFSGTFFSNKTLMNQMMVILLVSLLLMYFILAAQFESFVQPLIVLLEIPIDICASLALLMVLGHTLNLMSAIGIVVSCGIIINDSILKVDIMNQLRKSGLSIMDAIHEAGSRRLNSIIMTSLTSIVCMLPLFFTSDMGSELEKPLAVSIIGGMLIGTPISLFVVPLAYWWVYNLREKYSLRKTKRLKQ